MGTRPLHEPRHQPGGLVAASEYGPLPGGEITAAVPGVEGSTWRTAQKGLNMKGRRQRDRSGLKDKEEEVGGQEKATELLCPFDLRAALDRCTRKHINSKSQSLQSKMKILQRGLLPIIWFSTPSTSFVVMAQNRIIF